MGCWAQATRVCCASVLYYAPLTLLFHRLHFLRYMSIQAFTEALSAERPLAYVRRQEGHKCLYLQPKITLAGGRLVLENMVRTIV